MKIEAVKEKHEKRLMQLPNVICVGIGIKSGKDVIKIFVKRKTPKFLLQAEHTIPKILEGYEIAIEEIGEIIQHAAI
jgi:hypothetical protein